MKYPLVTTMLGAGLLFAGFSAATSSQTTRSSQSTTDPSFQSQLQQLQDEVRNNPNAYGKRPRKKFISSSTTQYAYAQYFKQWAARTERIGNSNYPQQANKQHIHGDVIVTVGINRDGSLNSVQITRSSGSRILDDAAKAIVRAAAPFAPLPPDKSVDILYITNTWRFQPASSSKT